MTLATAGSLPCEHALSLMKSTCPIEGCSPLVPLPSRIQDILTEKYKGVPIDRERKSLRNEVMSGKDRVSVDEADKDIVICALQGSSNESFDKDNIEIVHRDWDPYYGIRYTVRQ